MDDTDMSEIELFSLAWFVLFPAGWLCFWYGLDMLLDDVVPMSARQIKRRVELGGA